MAEFKNGRRKPKRGSKAWYIQQVHIAKSKINMDDAAYRSVLGQIKRGATSSKQLTLPELHQLMHRFTQLGYKPASSNGVAAIKKARWGKIAALWFALHEAQVVRDSSIGAMHNWCLRLTHSQKPEWLDPNQLNQCIEGLKAWAKREGLPLEP